MYLESQERKPILKKYEETSNLSQGIFRVQKILQKINSKDFLQCLQIKNKPEQTSKKIIQKLLLPIKLKSKYESQLSSIDKKERELEKEVKEMKSTIEKMEKKVR